MINLKNLLTEDKDPLYVLAYSKDKKEITAALNHFRKSMWTKSDIQRAVEKYKKANPPKTPSIALFDVLPRKQSDWSYEQATSNKFKSAREEWRKKYGTKRWTVSLYKQWIKDMAGNGGKNHSYDMAQNAIHEPGLIAFVTKQMVNGETPLERIQWDIEAN